MKFNKYIQLLFVALLLVSQSIFAQTPPLAPAKPEKPAKPVSPPALLIKPPKPPKEHTIKLKEHEHLLKNLDIKLKDLNLKLKEDLTLKLNRDLKDLTIAKIPEFNFNHDFNFTPGSDTESQSQTYNTVEKVKRVTKSYRVNNKNKLSIDNQYGKVVINVWPKNEIKVDIEIKAYEGSESEAQKLLDAVSIDENDNGELIDFETVISKSTGGWGMSRGSGGKEKRRGVSIDYVVYMPIDNPLEISNKFGSIAIAEFNGPLTIKNSYGSFTAKELRNTANVIEVRYGSASVQKFVGGSINVSYGSLKISDANQVRTDVRFGSTTIEKLSNGGNLENKYGGIKIGELDNNSKPLVIIADKGSVTMGMKSSPNFDFDVTVNMGGFHYPDNNVVITSKTPENPSRPVFVKNYKGEIGKGSESAVQIKCSYGSVKFQ